MAEAEDSTGETPLTPEWTPAPRMSPFPWRGDRPGVSPSVASLPGVEEVTGAVGSNTVPGAQAIRPQSGTGARTTWQPSDYRLVNVTVNDECQSAVSAGSWATIADFYERVSAGSR